MPRTIATTTDVDREGLLEFVRPRHHMVLMTVRGDGGWQGSPVTGGVDPQGRIVVSTYPQRAKAVNVARRATASVVVLSDDFGGPWVQVDGDAELLTDEYRAAMLAQGKALIRVTPTRWSPVATGGFPARLA
jgi:hypothetical protein